MGDLSKNFSRFEFACNCGCGFDTVDSELVTVKQDVRDHFNKYATCLSGCRCSYWNIHEGGSDDSQHMKAKASDFIVMGVLASAVYDYLDKKYPDKYGIGKYRDRTHIDVRPNKVRWDKT